MADQDDVPGTGRAVECALDAPSRRPEGTVLVTYGDVPLLTARHAAGAGRSARDLVRRRDPRHRQPRPTRPATAGCCATPDGDVAAIVEHRDADAEQRAVHEINSGIYAFDAAVLRDGAGRVEPDNAQGEMYLTDVIAIARGGGQTVRAHPVDDVWQTEGVNDRVQLARAGRRAQPPDAASGWMRDGVDDRRPGHDLGRRRRRPRPRRTVLPGHPAARRDDGRRGRVIGPDTTLTDVEVGDGATVVRTQALLAVIGAGAERRARSPTCVPAPSWARTARSAASSRPRTPRSAPAPRCPHLTYVGDATIGEGANIGAGTIFANYDGVAKHQHHRRADTASSAATPCSSPRCTSADGAYVGGGLRDHATMSEPGELAVSARPQRNIDGLGRRAPGRAAPRPPSGRAADGGQRRHERCRAAPKACRGHRGRVTGIMKTTEKHLMVFSGRAHPELAEEVATRAGHRAGADERLRLRQRRDLRAVRGVGARLRRLRHPEPHGADQRVDHGAADHGRRPQAGLGQADHRRAAVLRLRPPGQEAPRPRADLGPADGRPVQDGRRRPADGASTCTPRRSRASSTARSTT